LDIGKFSKGTGVKNWRKW